MSDSTVLAVLLGPLGALGAMYMLTALAATLYGPEPLSPALRRLAGVTDTQTPAWQRVGRAFVLAGFLIALEAAVAVALLERRAEFNIAGQVLLLIEPLGAFAWVAYLIRAHRR